MTGHVYKRGPNAYAIKIPIGKYLNGKTKYLNATFHGTHKAADKRCAELVLEITRGQFTNADEMTVGAFLDRWLRFIDNTDLASETKRPYHLHVEKHFKVYIVKVNRYQQIPMADLRLVDLSPEILQEYFKWTLANGRRNDQTIKKEERGKPRDRSLSTTTVHAHSRTWHVALEWARRQRWITENPVNLTKPPQPERRKIRRLKVAEAKTLLRSTAGEWLHPLLSVALYTGLRQGEQLALRWEDVDWEERTVWPKRTLEKAGLIPRFKEKTKNKSSNAPVPIVEAVVAELRELRKKQVEQRLAAGPLWGVLDNNGVRRDLGLIFTSVLGTPLSGNDLTRNHLRRALDQAGLPRINWQALRHSTGSLLADLGVDIKIIQVILRHATIAVTANTYTDPDLDVARRALEKVERAIK